MASTGRFIQVSMTHTVLGLVIGATIEGLLPRFNADASLASLAFETLVQAGLNGVALALVAEPLQAGDVTSGLPFSMALFQAQGGLSARVEHLAAVVKDQVAQGVQRTESQAAAL